MFGTGESIKRTFRAVSGLRVRWLTPNQPVIICPYIHNSDVEHMRRAFRLDSPSGRRLPFFFWKDEHCIGPELAFEHCWNQFPGRDIIIVHTDMSPMPDDTGNKWYDTLLAYSRALPEAGIVACDLLYPLQSANGGWLVQSGGGYFEDGRIAYVGGGVDVPHSIIGERAQQYTAEFNCVREVEWVTFGGVYIRREVIDQCGGFDRRYKWAYVKDVDYSLEARSRGFRLFQVPVTLLHEESRTTRQFLADPFYIGMMGHNFEEFYAKWAASKEASTMLNYTKIRNGPLIALSILNDISLPPSVDLTPMWSSALLLNWFAKFWRRLCLRQRD